MENLLGKLGLTEISIVGISVSSSNLIEIISIDKKDKEIKKYACRELKYNNAIREIINYDDFSIVVQELFNEIGVNPKNCNVVLNIPNVHFGFKSIALSLQNDEIVTAVTSEAEDLYLFKRHEPVISWNTVSVNENTDSRYIVYGAVQQNTIQNLKDIFEELGAKLVAIESSNSALIKGIIYSGILEEEIFNNETSNILLLSANSYSIFCMQGKKLVDYYEEPLAIKSFTNEEIYQIVSDSSNESLDNYPAKNLLIVSETNDISAEMLSQKINFNGDIKYLDRNIYSKKSFMDVSHDVLSKYSPLISVEAVGTGAYNYDNYPVKFNFSSASDDSGNILRLTIKDQEYEIDKAVLMKVFMMFCVILLLFFGGLWLIFKITDDRALDEKQRITDEIKSKELSIEKLKLNKNDGNVYSLTNEIDGINKKNVVLIKLVATEIPVDTYISSFYCNSLPEIRIIGVSRTSDSIYTYVKRLKSEYPSLKISQLKISYNEVNPNITEYSFIIENDEAMKNRQSAEEQERLDKLSKNAGTKKTSGIANKNLLNNIIPKQPATGNASSSTGTSTVPDSIPAPIVP